MRPFRSSAARLQANRANAQQSTGPKTEEGKAAVSQNNLRHGLCGQFSLLSWEKMEDYAQLIQDLRAEHQPATPTEALLVDRLAQHHWLLQRAMTLQGTVIDDQTPICEYERKLALYIRYQTTHERAFHKCLAELAKLRAERRKEVLGFESQKHREAAEIRKQEVHQLRLQAANTRLNSSPSPKAHNGVGFSPRENPAPLEQPSAPMRQAA